MKQFFFLFFLLITISCKKVKESDPIESSCNFTEEYFGGMSLTTYAEGEKAAQRFNVVSKFHITQVTFELDVMNSESVTLFVYRAIDGENTPGGTLLGKTTIQSDMVQNTGKISFNFKKGPLVGGETYDYYFILEAAGGSFRLRKSYKPLFDLVGEVWEFDGINWIKRQDYDLSIGMKGKCS